MKIYLDNNLGVTNVEQEELTQDTIGYNILKVYIPNAVLTPYNTFTCYYGALLQNGRKVGWFAMEARTSSDADYEANYTLYKATLEQCIVSVEGKVYIGCQVLLGNSGNATLIKKNTAVVQFNVRKSVAINNDILVLDTDQTTTDVLESYKNLLENALLTYATKTEVYTQSQINALLLQKADKSDTYTKAESDNKFAPKTTAITHTGNQLKDNNDNNIYPILDDNQVSVEKTNFAIKQTTNKFAFRDYELTINGGTIKLYEGNKIKLDGTFTSAVSINLIDYCIFDYIIGNTTDYVSCRTPLNGSDSNVNCQLQIRTTADNVWHSLFNFRGHDIGGLYKFVNGNSANPFNLTSGYNYIRLQIPATTFDNFINEVWVNEGTTALPFENYNTFGLPNYKYDNPNKYLLDLGINLSNIVLSSGKTPLITWVDDDTSSAEAISKVKTICDNLGIKATFGCITSNLSNQTLLNTLLDYQQNGFHICSHTNVHNRWYKADGGLPMFTLSECETDLITSLKILKENLFLDSDMFIYSGSSSDRVGIEKIISKWCKCALTPTGGSNHLYANGKYKIKRVFIVPTNTLQYYKDLIDDVYENGDWLIFGTHSGITSDWDGTLVNNVMSYAISKGIEIKTLNSAFKQRNLMYNLYDLFK